MLTLQGTTRLIVIALYMDNRLRIIPSGTLFEMQNGELLEVLNYVNATKVLVQFIDRKSPPFYAHIGNLRKGKYKNKFYPSLFGAGFEGIGNFSFKEDKFAVNSWRGIIQRAFSKLEKDQRPNTVDVTIHEDWCNFQKFAEWAVCQKGYGKYKFEIDKDLIVLGNSHYSPDFCCYLPREINTRLPKRYGSFDKVYYYSDKNRYKAFYTDSSGKKKSIIGSTYSEVSMTRKILVNKMIKDISEKYFKDLDEVVVNRLSNYYNLNEVIK